MLFNSFSFLIFLPIVLLVYYMLPIRIRWVWLLISSYYFYMSWNAAYALLLLFSTAVTWFGSLLMEKADGHAGLRKLALVFSFLINIGILAFYKYAGFLAESINGLLTLSGTGMRIPRLDILLPVGISFYVFQALGYTVDVYRNEIEAEKNFFRYALFVSFFPQLVAGPIERSKNLLKQINTPTTLSFENLKVGFLQILWGFFLKLVIADNASVVIDTVFSDIHTYPGVYIVIATILFAFQIYGDFGGYSLIAIGSARMLGFEIMRNFDSPYFSSGVAEFWRRWHISLSTWFRDYLYIPLGGNRKGPIRKNINLLIVFLVSGLWHGAAWHFVAWGALNGLYQVISNIKKYIGDKLAPENRLHSWDKSVSVKFCRIVGTFILVDFAWLFFRADSIKHAFEAIKSMVVVHNTWILFDGSLFELGLVDKQFRSLIVAIFILSAIDYLRYKKIDLIEIFMKQPFVIRAVLYTLLAMSALIFGHWAGGYDNSAFLYFQF